MLPFFADFVYAFFHAVALVDTTDFSMVSYMDIAEQIRRYTRTK
jgi:hypothetical protein